MGCAIIEDCSFYFPFPEKTKVTHHPPWRSNILKVQLVQKPRLTNEPEKETHLFTGMNPLCSQTQSLKWKLFNFLQQKPFTKMIWLHFFPGITIGNTIKG